MKKNIFIEVFSEISASAFGKTDIKPIYEAQNTALVICSSLDAMNEFGGCCDSRTAQLMRIIRDKFKNDNQLEKEINNFIDDIDAMIISSNRYWLDFGKLSTTIKQLQSE